MFTMLKFRLLLPCMPFGGAIKKTMDILIHLSEKRRVLILSMPTKKGGDGWAEYQEEIS